MRFADGVLSWAAFACLAAAVLVGPWFFGAWEMWVFWPFALFLFLAAVFSGLRLMARAAVGPGDEQEPPYSAAGTRAAAMSLLACVPFVLYAVTGMVAAEVHLDAERSVLLLVLPLLVAAHVFYGFTASQRRALYGLILANLALLAVYGLVNHAVTESRLVLWREGYPQYVKEARATGTYFCPDHFSGVMELGLCLALGLLFGRGVRAAWKLAAAALGLMALAGVVLSKSRGGGLTVIVVLGAAFVWGVLQWRARVRWAWRGGMLVAAALALVLFARFAEPYMARFNQYFAWQEARGRPAGVAAARVLEALSYSDRGLMVRAALRAWRTNPAFGIGPGMHRHLWPHFAPTPDGDRELGVWPSYPGNRYYAYEAHSDWVQLLEEYGTLGLILFAVAALAVFAALARAVCARGRRARDLGREAEPVSHAIALGALLSLIALAFHSLGDFNLKLPATTWLFGAILALGVVEQAEAREG
ncbi:MAG: hypothetical protein FJ225_08680 [Lentisphaerae bacterium]|nr:hypothetical protein [Lentisphaerota bacterium]